jgi:hypothetical protein
MFSIAMTTQRTARTTAPVTGYLHVLGLWAAAGTAPRQPAAHS